MTERLETARLVLRRPVAGDWEAARAFFTSARAEGIGGPYDIGRAWRIFAAEIGHWEIRGYGMWVVTRRNEDRALGMIGPWFPEGWPEREVGWMIWDDGVEGTGIAAEAARAAVNHAYSTLGWDSVVSYIAPENLRSIRLAERLGAVHDPDAPQPKPEAPCRVYRHPKPGVAA